MVSARGHPIFAALYDHLIGVAERNFLRPHRAWLAGELTGRVLDVGSGTGLSFAHYSAGADVVGVEPDPHMLQRARPRAEALGRRIPLLEACAEALPFPDASFDAAVSALVLCTVQDLEQALGELRRVLRPGGTLRFLEHVRSPSPGWARFQDAVTPLWSRLGGGCRPNRDTLAAIERAGFRIAEIEQYAKGPYPVRVFVRGVAAR
jgi:ubiquinone/menaquinone biosynthesis C-methylase UbiE